jgi:hypothetical protein
MPQNAPYTHTDGRTLYLGKGPARVDPRTFKLEKFLLPATPPPSANWYGGVTSFGAMLNENLGDCVVAAIGHAEQIATLNTPSGELTVSNNVIENVYEKACGYVPGNPSTDNGCVIVDTLNWVRQYGLGHRHPSGDAGETRHRHALYAYADPSVTDLDHIKQSIASFATLDLGLQLPITAQAQVGGLWTVVGNPFTDPNSQAGSWGGHSTICCAYDADTLTVITWGQLQVMDWGFFTSYVDEAHCLLMRAWLSAKGLPVGMNLAALDQELQALGN